MRLHQISVIPPLSPRELHVVQNYVNANHGFLPWNTGHMMWVPRRHTSKSCGVGIAGLSGHTDAMMMCLRLLQDFDVRKCTLACILWLVGSDHHSISEVLYVARLYGLEYNGTDPLDFVNELLQKV